MAELLVLIFLIQLLAWVDDDNYVSMSKGAYSKDRPKYSDISPKSSDVLSSKKHHSK